MAQVPETVAELYDQGVTILETPAEITSVSKIPTQQSDYPLLETKWLKITGVICVYVDMKDSSKLSAKYKDRDIASIYQSFVDTSVRILDHFGASYIDVRGDGAFGLFDRELPYHALVAAVTVKTFVELYMSTIVEEKLGEGVEVHIGIDQDDTLVKRVGLKEQEGETDKQNEVWAGKTVNTAAKLASLGGAGDLIVSPRFFARIQHRCALYSCDCHGDPTTKKPKSLWNEVSLLGDDRFDFNKAHKMSTRWCVDVGENYMKYLLAEDE